MTGGCRASRDPRSCSAWEKERRRPRGHDPGLIPLALFALIHRRRVSPASLRSPRRSMTSSRRVAPDCGDEACCTGSESSSLVCRWLCARGARARSRSGSTLVEELPAIDTPSCRGSSCGRRESRSLPTSCASTADRCGQVFLNDGTGRMGRSAPSASPRSRDDAVDWDGDGDQDLLVAARTDWKVTLLVNQHPQTAVGCVVFTRQDLPVIAAGACARAIDPTDCCHRRRFRRRVRVLERRGQRSRAHPGVGLQEPDRAGSSTSTATRSIWPSPAAACAVSPRPWCGTT